MNCDRCCRITSVWRMSRFNTDRICPECELKEQNHPMYARAVEAELEAVRAGNLNYEGIGKPDDL